MFKFYVQMVSPKTVAQAIGMGCSLLLFTSILAILERRKKDGMCSKVMAAIRLIRSCPLHHMTNTRYLYCNKECPHSPTIPNLNCLPDPDVIDSGTKQVHSSVNKEKKKV